jgi:molybdopterin/thiamine biosynthesis adenylyltransferase
MLLPPLMLDERLRYARQMGSGVLTRRGQRRLKAATALVTRAGGVGGPAALSLVLAGVGRVIIAHPGDLETADLNRQLLGSELGLGCPRASQFAAHLRTMNSFVTIEAIDHEPDDAEADELARGADIVLSCATDFDQRLRLNRAAHRAGVPLIDAAQWGMTGSLLVSNGQSTPCLACVYPETPPFEPGFPVVGAIAATMGNLAALEAIKILAGIGRPMWGRMLIVDGFRGEMRQVQLRRRDDCPVCATSMLASLRSSIHEVTVTISGRRYHLGPRHPGVLDLPAGATVDDALAVLKRDVCSRRCLVPSALVAVSGQHVGTVADHDILRLGDADDLFIFAPVAGG